MYGASGQAANDASRANLIALCKCYYYLRKIERTRLSLKIPISIGI